MTLKPPIAPDIVQGSVNTVIYASSGFAGTGGTIDLRNNRSDDYSAIQFNVTQSLIDDDAEFWRQKINWTTPQTGWASATSAAICRPFYLRVDHLATDATATQNVSNGVYSLLTFGSDSVTNPMGTSHAFTGGVAVKYSANSGNEHCCYFGYIRNDATTTPGRDWLMDLGVHGAITTQQSLLSGINLVTNNYYNGSPTAAESDGLCISTKPTTGAGAPSGTSHHDADTFPWDNAIHILGTSGTNASPTNAGFKRAIKIGGTGSGWNLTASRIQTGIWIQDFETNGIYVADRHSQGDINNAPAVACASGAGGVVVGADTIANPTTVLLEVTTTGSADPLVEFRSTASNGSISKRMRNTSGNVGYFVSGASNGFLTGTVAGDSGIIPLTTGKQFHVGGTTKVLTVSQDDKFGAFAATPVAKQTVTGSRGGNAALASLLTGLANLGWITDSSS